jgi:hypothetical protein
MELSDATEKTPAAPGIDPETLRIVGQCLNHYATPGTRNIIASHKSKPSSVSQGYVDQYPGSRGEVVTGAERMTYRVLWDTFWLKGFWSTQAKVEDIVLKAAWHWVSDSSVVKDGANGRGERCVQGFRWGSRGKETIGETQT